MTNKLEQFKQELAALLIKYNASIDVDWGDGSDMYGVYREGITVTIDRECLKLTSYDWYLDKDNIK